MSQLPVAGSVWVAEGRAMVATLQHSNTSQLEYAPCVQLSKCSSVSKGCHIRLTTFDPIDFLTFDKEIAFGRRQRILAVDGDRAAGNRRGSVVTYPNSLNDAGGGQIEA